MEGKDRPHQLGRKEYADLGATVSLMLRICKSIVGTGKSVVLDCVGVYSGFIIKKQHHLPKGVPGDRIDAHFQNK